MPTIDSSMGPSDPAAGWSVPRLEPERRWIAGVATGLATEIGVDAILVRAALVGLTLSSAVWPLLYVIGFLILSRRERSLPEQRSTPSPKGRDLAHRHLGFLVAVIGLVPLSAALDDIVPSTALLPVGLLTMGIALAWSRGGHAAQSPALRAGIGAALAIAGLVGLVLAWSSSAISFQLVGLIVLIAGGLALVASPWLMRTAQDLNEERAARIRADERSQIATHLHDSVLQTLSLIQKNAEDPNRTLQLARRQERQLRDWLYTPTTATDRTGTTDGTKSFRLVLSEIVDEVEEMHGVAIESVVVGHTTLDEPVAAMLRAMREALVNAAQHSGASRIDVYAELRPDVVEIFVRDTGVGFDPTAVSQQRRGIADSVRGRMQRVDGSATIHSAPDRGTEVELRLPRSAERPRATIAKDDDGD